jgi:DNA-binding response OmpR family regulator
VADNLPKKILIVDADASTAGSVKDKFQQQYKVEVVSANDMEQARYWFEGEHFPVVFIDVLFHELPGLVLIQKFRSSAIAEKLATSFVLMIGKNRKPEEDTLIAELGGIETITKPFNMLAALPYLSRGLVNYQQNLVLERKWLECMELAQKGDISRIDELGTTNRALQMKARLFETADQNNQGLKYFQDLASKNGENAVLKHYLGHFSSLLNLTEEALGHLEPLNQRTPKHLQRVRNMVRLYVEGNNADNAKKYVLELLGYYEDESAIKFEILDLLMEKGMDSAAAEIAAKVASPKDILRYYNNLGVNHSSSGDHQGAIQAYQRCIRLCPKSKEIYRIHFNMALSFSRLKTPDANENAITHLEKCLELNKEFEKAQNALKAISARKVA